MAPGRFRGSRINEVFRHMGAKRKVCRSLKQEPMMDVIHEMSCSAANSMRKLLRRSPDEVLNEHVLRFSVSSVLVGLDN